MVDVTGHLGMALLWLAPAWFLLDYRKTAVTFVAVGVPFGMLPDVDLVLEGIFTTIKHHGAIHTILAVTIFAAVLGPIVGKIVEAVAGDTDWLSPEAAAHSVRFGFLAVWIPGLAHVFADMLSAPDIADSIEPLWPLYHGSIGVDLVWYNNPVVNWGLLIVGVLVNVGLFLYLGNRSRPE